MFSLKKITCKGLSHWCHGVVWPWVNIGIMVCCLMVPSQGFKSTLSPLPKYALFSNRVGVRYRRWYLGTGTGTWELARYRYRYMIFQKYLGTGTGTHEKYLGTGTGTLYDGVTKNQTCFQILILCVHLSSDIYILKCPVNHNARKWHSLSLCKTLYSYVHLYIQTDVNLW